MSWKAEVNTYSDSSDTWTSNALRFATVEEATAYANNLFSRWTAVRHVRTVEAPGEPITHKWDKLNHRAESLASSPIPPIEPNAVKRGTRLRMNDGSEGEMRDSKMGVIRLIAVGSDLGSAYVWTATHAFIDNMWRPIELSKAQARLRRDIEKGMNDLGNTLRESALLEIGKKAGETKPD